MSRVSPLRFIEPQLASLVDEPPEGKHWIHEIKHDGYRCQVLIEPVASVYLRATATIGLIASPPSLAPRAASNANQRNWMVRR